MTAPWTPPGIGEIVYLTSCLIDMAVSAQTTQPDTPNQYSATLGVAGDAGDMNLDAVMGPQGAPGQPVFALQYQRSPLYDNPSQLPPLTNSPSDIGKYWLIDELDTNGFYLTTWCYIWWGSYYRQIMMGTVGNPGPVPAIDPLMEFVVPGTAAAVNVSGSTASPTWQFLCPSPTGAPGPAAWLGEFPDVNEASTPPGAFNVLAFTGNYTGASSALPGAPEWVPFNIEQYLTQLYSMPQSSFTPYSGISQQANIGSFALPPQPFPWTPLVWGHLAAGGLSVGSDPLLIGAQVLLDNATTGQMVARGIGTALGNINIVPHYSTPQKPNVCISPGNGYAAVPAGQAATLYVNLWNDGQMGYYSFRPTASLPGWQQNLDNLTTQLGHPVATVESVVGQLNNYIGAVPSEIQAALNHVAQIVGPQIQGAVNAVEQSAPVQFVDHTVSQVAQYLTQFQPLVTGLANNLGIPALDQNISNISAQLQAWTAPITAEVQNSIDSVAQQIGLPGLGNTTAAVANQLDNLQPALQNLADRMGQPVTTAISQLSSFGGTVTSSVQGAIDAVAGNLGQAAGLTTSALHDALSTFQSNLDAVANATGLSGVGNSIHAVIGSAVQFIGQTVGAPLQSAIDGVVNSLGTSGVGHSILDMVNNLLTLAGSLFSGYTTDAQLFISIQPLLELGGL